MPNLWTYEQKFNDLNTANLNGQDSWVVTDGTISVVETGTPYEGTKHVAFTGDDSRVNRDITAVVSGTMYFSLKSSDVNNSIGIRLYKGAYVTIGPALSLAAGGDIYFYDGTTWTDSGENWIANTYYRIGIMFECGAGGWEGLAADTWKFNINGGSWSTAKGFYGATDEISRLYFQHSGTSTTSWLDYISPNYTPPALVHLKTWNGIAKANIKTINGKAIANVKTINGVS